MRCRGRIQRDAHGDVIERAQPLLQGTQAFEVAPHRGIVEHARAELGRVAQPFDVLAQAVAAFVVEQVERLRIGHHAAVPAVQPLGQPLAQRQLGGRIHLIERRVA
jgi:hypothetical protein